MYLLETHELFLFSAVAQMYLWLSSSNALFVSFNESLRLEPQTSEMKRMKTELINIYNIFAISTYVIHRSTVPCCSEEGRERL